METVLGLSLTSSSVGWVLLDGSGADATTLDNDVFDVADGSVDDDDISKHLAAVRGALSIAATSGYQLTSISLTWTYHAAAKANLLLKSLPDLGFDTIVSVQLAHATRSWAQAFGGALGFEKAAVCIVEDSETRLFSIRNGVARPFTTHSRDGADSLSCWISDIFATNYLDPEYLFLVASRGDLEKVSECVSEELSMPVVTSDEAQLIFARGAVFSMGSDAETAAVPLTQRPNAVGRARSWFGSPARAAALVVGGVVAISALGLVLADRPESGSTEAASNSSETSANIQSVPAAAPPAATVVQRVAQPAAAMPALESAWPTGDFSQTVVPPVAPLTEVVAPQASVPVAPLAVPPVEQAPVVALPGEVAPLPEPAEVAHLTEPAETVHMPGLAAQAPAPHLPPEAAAQTALAPPLPGPDPALAALPTQVVITPGAAQP